MAFPSGWSRRCAITINHLKVPSSQSGFPVLLGYNAVGSEHNLPDEMLDSASAFKANSNGSDIRFTSDLAGANGLHAEIVLFTQNATAGSRKAEIWVNCNPSSSVDTVIYVWYNNAAASAPAANDATFGSQGVWDSNFKFVWHCPNGTVLSAADSTSNANNGTLGSAVGGGAVPDPATGKIDGGASFNTADRDFIESPSINMGTSMTFSAWASRTALGGNYRGIIYNDYNTGMGIGIVGGSTLAVLFIKNDQSINGGSLPADGSWHYVVGTYDGTTGRLYIDGVQVASGAVAAPTIGSSVISAGVLKGTGIGPNEAWGGSIDEERASTTARSANWIAAEYNNQNDPSTFSTPGTPVGVGGSLFTVSSLSGLGAGGKFFQNPLN